MAFGPIGCRKRFCSAHSATARVPVRVLKRASTFSANQTRSPGVFDAVTVEDFFIRTLCASMSIRLNIANELNKAERIGEAIANLNGNPFARW